MGNKSSPLNQNPHLPLRSWTWKEEESKEVFPFVFRGGGGSITDGEEGWGQLQVKNRCLTTGEVKTHGPSCYTFPSE